MRYFEKKSIRQQHLFIMRGIPGSGKSTLARKIQAKFPDSVIAANDDFYYDKDGKYSWSPERRVGAIEATRQKVENALKEGKTAIADTVAYTHDSYSQLVDLAKKYKVNAHEVLVKFDSNTPELYANRNLHFVNVDTIKDMINKFEFGKHPKL